MNIKNQISVVVSIYNMEKYLERFLKTLVVQRYIYEIILIDDGSTDRSHEICDLYEKKYGDLIKVIHKKNGGLSSARNAGIDIATGEFIIFPDPDDWLEKDYLEKLIELKIKYNSDLSCTGYYIDNETKSEYANKKHRFKIMSGLEARKELIVSHYLMGFAWNKLFNLKYIKDHNLYFRDDVGTTEDLDFLFRYLKYCNRVVYDPAVRTYHYCQHDLAQTHGAFSLNKYKSIETYLSIIDQCGYDKEIDNAAKTEICNIIINLIPLYFISNEKNNIVYEDMKKYLKMYLKNYVKCKQYGPTRKMQAILARFMPYIYFLIIEQIKRG